MDYKKLCKEVGELLERSHDDNNDKTVIVVWGLMNGGKSFLLNMLTDHVNEDFFKTNDVRETAAIKTYETEQFIFIDTPGLDASTNDDLIAHKGVKDADIVLFVHQTQGSLEKNEIDFLRQLKNSFGEYANKNIILVLSKIDRETPEKVELIHEDIIKQCENIIGFSPRCFSVSGTRYQQGVQKNKNGLIQSSHVDHLKKYLLKLDINISSIRETRIFDDMEYFEDELRKSYDQLSDAIYDIENEISQKITPFNDQLQSFSTWLEQKSSEYNNI